ncbi:hypothetical protein [Polyangium fumosum]|uniref:Uncharacterized protein n=1 Tax=Polyangium fumosum TaxID=889272 RepID=A0A4U1JBF9_9BACT|nr:hypothetical protein [Polyangium fumosum]TKD07359.1 hypothetical protein E8A74_18100 [Polyangium fumosum]
MKAASDQGYFSALAHDLRVRERLLAAGVITQADIDSYLAGLSELETEAEGLGIPQPALVSASSAAAPAPQPIAAAPAPAPAVSSAAVDVEDDIDDAADEAGEA